MRYFGGKTRTCNDISGLIKSLRKQGQLFVSPFIGGGWVECLVDEPKQCSDKHKYLIAMYQELQNGWIPPKELTKEEYYYIKNHKNEKPYLTGFVGFGCSFAGKWFGGYAKDNTKRNFCSNAHNSILKKMKGLLNTRFECISYDQLDPKDSIIYCDPPYFRTTQYAEAEVGVFDTNKFWEVMNKWGKNNTVLVSEYHAPKNIKCIWQKIIKMDIRTQNNKNNSKESRTEKVFRV